MTTVCSIMCFIVAVSRNKKQDNSSLVLAYLWPSVIFEISQKLILVNNFIHMCFTYHMEIMTHTETVLSWYLLKWSNLHETVGSI